MLAAGPARADVRPEAYGASHSLRTIACSTHAGSNRLSCPGGAGDFRRGQGIDIVAAGETTPIPPPRGLRLSIKGAGDGGVKVAYALCAADLWKGISGCAEAAISGAPVRPSAPHHVVVEYEHNLPNAAIWLLYRRIEDGPWRFVTTLNGYPFDDLGWTQPDSAGWPLAPPAAPVNQDFFSTVAAIAGHEIVLADPVPASRPHAAVRHDDVLAVQAAYDACKGGTVRFGPYHYRLVRPSVWNFTTRRFYYTYTRATPGYPDLYPEGVLHPPSNCATIGAGRKVTFLLTDFMNEPNGGAATFGLNAGSRMSLNDPAFFASRTYPIANAPRSSTFVQTNRVADAAAFAAGDYVMVKGGLPVAGPDTASSEIDRVTSVDRASGRIHLMLPLAKPVPLGPVGTPPAIVKLGRDIVTNVSFAHMTIQTYSSAFSNVSPVYHAHLDDLYLPLPSNGSFWYGGYRRDWTNRDVDLADTVGTELDLDQDFLWQGGSCHSIEGNCFGGSEASVNLKFLHTKLSSVIRFGEPSNLLISVQSDIGGFELVGSTLTQDCGPNARDGAAVGGQGGRLDDDVPVGFTVENNRIVTNCPKGITVRSAYAGLRIVGNEIRQKLDNKAPWAGIFAGSGNIEHNLITVIEQAGAADQYCGIGGYAGGLPKQVNLSSPWTIRGNTVKVDGATAHCGVYIGDTGVLDPQQITVTNNRFENLALGIVVANPAHTPNIALGTNPCATCTVQYLPADLPKLLRNEPMATNKAAAPKSPETGRQ